MFDLPRYLFVGLFLCACGQVTDSPADTQPSGGNSAGNSEDDLTGGSGGDSNSGGIRTGGTGGTAACALYNPLNTWEPPRKVLGFEPREPLLSDDSIGWGGAGPLAGGCEHSTGMNAQSLCQGDAVTVLAQTGPVLVLGDGSELAWTEGPIYADFKDGQRVWISFHERHPNVCSFCGSYLERSLEVRERQGGQLLYVAYDGHRTSGPPVSLIEELFEVAVHTEEVCTSSIYTAGCSTWRRTIFDRVVETDEPQRLLNSTPSQVDTPGGRYDIFWATTVESFVSTYELCADGPGPAGESGFVVSRLR